MKITQPISLEPRKVSVWKQGVKIVNESVVPTPFGIERAQEILSEANQKLGPLEVAPCMTLEELAFTHAVWDAIEDGGSSFNTAFTLILRGEIPASYTRAESLKQAELYITDAEGLLKLWRTSATYGYHDGEQRNLERHLDGISKGEKAYQNLQGFDSNTARLVVMVDGKDMNGVYEFTAEDAKLLADLEG